MGAGGSKGSYPAALSKGEFDYRSVSTDSGVAPSVSCSDESSAPESPESTSSMSPPLVNGVCPMSSSDSSSGDTISPALSSSSERRGGEEDTRAVQEMPKDTKPSETGETPSIPSSSTSGDQVLPGKSVSIAEVRMRQPRKVPSLPSTSSKPLVISPSHSDTHLEKVKQCDVMISYSHRDKEFMKRIKDCLEKNNISVWVDVTMGAGVNFLNKIGEAIIDSKIFISLLTEHTVQSKFCQDELALAYISNKPIIPVSLRPQDQGFKEIPTGMMLQLASFEWSHMTMDSFADDFRVLFKRIKTILAEIHKEELAADISPLPPTPQDLPFKRKPVFKKKSTKQKLNVRRPLSRCSSIIESVEETASRDFWEKNFGEVDVVTWERFETALVADYVKQLSLSYNQYDKEWFTNLLKRELEVGEDDLLPKSKYQDFISDDYGSPLSIYDCVTDLVVENYTMKEVFNIESSVRLDAINHLAKYGSVAVVEALLDLLDDPDHNVRASACVSLAKIKAGEGPMKIERLMQRLNDSDRFVRESACVALGYLKADKAVSTLIKIWRNDPMSEVRQAARSALDTIGGQEVHRAMDATKALSEEIGKLTQLLTVSGRPIKQSSKNSSSGFLADTQLVRDAFMKHDGVRSASLPRQHKVSFKGPSQKAAERMVSPPAKATDLKAASPAETRLPSSATPGPNQAS